MGHVFVLTLVDMLDTSRPRHRYPDRWRGGLDRGGAARPLASARLRFTHPPHRQFAAVAVGLLVLPAPRAAVTAELSPDSRWSRRLRPGRGDERSGRCRLVGGRRPRCPRGRARRSAGPPGGRGAAAAGVAGGVGRRGFRGAVRGFGASSGGGGWRGSGCWRSSPVLGSGLRRDDGLGGGGGRSGGLGLGRLRRRLWRRQLCLLGGGPTSRSCFGLRSPRRRCGRGRL